MVTHANTTKPKRLQWLWIVVAVLFAVAAVGALWWWKFANTSTSGACKAGDLTLSIGSTQSAEGTTFTRAVVTNKGKTACTINGYPVASILDAKGENHFTSDAQQNTSYAATAVEIAPHEKAHAVLGFPDADNFDAGVCSDTMKMLRMYLPGEEITPATKSLSTPLERKVCPGFSVTVFRAGA